MRKKAAKRSTPAAALTTWRVVGSCGVCLGPVCAAASFRGAPPLPTCAHCGRTPAQPWGPFIEMQKDSGPVVTSIDPEKGTITFTTELA